MLDYTKAAGKRVWRNIKITTLVLNLVAQLSSIFYLIYILWTGSGVFALNVILLALSCGYFAFFTFTCFYAQKKQLKRWVKLSYKWCKRVVKLFNLGVLIYGIASSKEYTALSLMMTAVLLFVWILDLLVEILSHLVRIWGALLYEGMQADIEKVKAPVTATKNFFKRLTGQEVEEKPEPTKNRLFLDELVEEERTERKNEKLEKKHLKKLAKAEKRKK